jgi:hypothetical protein
MAMYYFYLRDNKTLSDVDGTEFVDASEARSHRKMVDFAADSSLK